MWCRNGLWELKAFQPQEQALTPCICWNLTKISQIRYKEQCDIPQSFDLTRFTPTYSLPLLPTSSYPFLPPPIDSYFILLPPTPSSYSSCFLLPPTSLYFLHSRCKGWGTTHVISNGASLGPRPSKIPQGLQRPLKILRGVFDSLRAPEKTLLAGLLKASKKTSNGLQDL